MRALEPPGWPRARGYAHGIEAQGRLVFTAGQIGWGPDGGFPSSDLAGQVRQTLANVVAERRPPGGDDHGRAMPIGLRQTRHSGRSAR